MSKKTKTTNDPWAPAQPLILKSLNATSQTYDANQPQLQKYANMQQDTYGRLAPGAEAGIVGSQNLVNDTLSGKYLNGNPHLQGVIDSSNRDITDGVNGQFEMSGRYGSGKHAGVLADSLAKNENALRYGDYSQERAYQNNAVGQAQGLMGGATSLLNNAADLPWVGTAALSGGIRQSSNGYGTTTQTTSDPMGSITGLIGAGASAYSAYKSDVRSKDISHQVGTTPDGLPIYDFTYKDDPTKTPQAGPIAQDVEKVRPDAMGPTGADGMKSVDYGKLGLPDPTTLAGGGANEITPEALPTVYPNKDNVDRSFGAILGRFSNPDPNDKWGRIGLLGQYLMAGEGSPFQSLGKGLLGAQQQSHDDMQAQNEAAIKARAADSEYDLRGAQADYYRQRGDKAGAPAAPRILQLRDGSVISIDPATGEQTVLHGPIATSEPMVATDKGYQPRSKAQGMMPYRAPPRASSGGGKPGGVTPTASAKYRAEAEAAIARGADPKAVYARLAKIGVH